MNSTQWKNLNRYEKREKIALLCGWERGPKKTKGVAWFVPVNSAWHKKADGPYNWQDNPPDYLNDLNAMHEAEESIKRGSIQETKWIGMLELITFGVVCPERHEVVQLQALVKATAAQRAEAFVLVMTEDK